MTDPAPGGRSAAGLHRTIPALPVRDVAASVNFYRERLGFEAVHHDGDFAVLVRDDAVVHLWGATDRGWAEREDLRERPVSGVTATDFGTREFATLDADGNLLTFFRWNDG